MRKKKQLIVSNRTKSIVPRVRRLRDTPGIREYDSVYTSCHRVDGYVFSSTPSVGHGGAISSTSDTHVPYDTPSERRAGRP